MKIAFLVPYPLNEVPSQRFRFEQYFSTLESMHSITKHPFFSIKAYCLFYSGTNSHIKTWIIIKGVALRWLMLPRILNMDYVFIHREAAPIGPPVFEWLIAKVLRKKIIYDFDDAIWLTDRTSESALVTFLRSRSKVGQICKWSYKVSCGNAYLADFAWKYNPDVVVNPTTIDTLHVHNPDRYTKPSFTTRNARSIVIGWTGSHSTLKYLSGVVPVLQQLQEKHDGITFLVIADQKPDLPLKKIEFIPWQKETEIQDLLRLDIGIMPLPDDAWTRGKCGFKALQYMAMEIPCVVSAVGVNAEIVDHGQTGFLATTENDWLNFLEQLIQEEGLRNKMGEAGRKKVVDRYSVASNAVNFLSLFT